jgi:LacI family transcriptional regulator
VFVTNASAHCVAEASRNIRTKRPFVIIGYDLVHKNYSLLIEGAIDAIISQRPETQGRRGLLDLYRHLVLGQKIHRHVDVPIDLYLQENVPPLPAEIKHPAKEHVVWS